MIAARHLAIGCALLWIGCKEAKPKLTMAPADVVNAIRDYADRGCACEADKECFREIRGEFDAAKKELVRNAKLLTGADLDTYTAERQRFGMCGDGAGLAVWDNL